MIYNGVTFDDFSVIEYVRRHLMPPRSVNYRNTGDVGSVFTQVSHDVSGIEVDVRVIGKTRQEVLDTYNVMAAALYSDKPLPLRLRDQPGRYNLAIIDSNTELHNFLHTGFITLNFKCPDPYLYSEELTKLTNINNVSCINRGGAPSNGIITIKVNASVSFLNVSLPMSNEFIRITHPFVNGNTVTINLETEEVFLNTSTFLPTDLSSTFFKIPTGFFTLVSSNGVVDLEYRERWF